VEGFAGLGPVEVFADGAEDGEGDGLVEVFEVAAGADVDALDAGLFVEDEGEGEGVGCAGEDADLGDDAADAEGAEGSGDGAEAADFDDEIDAFAAGFVEGPLVPLGVFVVVDAGV